MDEALQREVAARMVRELDARGAAVVLVGSTAVVALGLYPKTTKDADALGPPELTLAEGRRIMRALADDMGLRFHEAGWGTLSCLKMDERGEESWRMDLIVPQEGPIPPRAAALIHVHARPTPLGRVALPEHVLVMKAVARGDCIGKGDALRADQYESDLLDLRRALRRLDEEKVATLLAAYPDSRAGPAARAINEVFGTRFPEPFDPNV